MWVKITSGTVINGVGAVLADTVHELDGKRARELFVAGTAVPCDEPKPEPVKPEPEEVEKPVTRKPKVTTRYKK